MNGSLRLEMYHQYKKSKLEKRYSYNNTESNDWTYIKIEYRAWR